MNFFNEILDSYIVFGYICNIKGGILNRIDYGKV